jgi:hypothetical protein
MTKSKTERAQYVCDHKDDENGNVWIYLEPQGPGLRVLGNGFLRLNFRKGTSLEEVGQVMEFFNQNMENISHTYFLEDAEGQ